jgi:hypothetical protein
MDRAGRKLQASAARYTPLCVRAHSRRSRSAAKARQARMAPRVSSGKSSRISASDMPRSQTFEHIVDRDDCEAEAANTHDPNSSGGAQLTAIDGCLQDKSVRVRKGYEGRASREGRGRQKGRFSSKCSRSHSGRREAREDPARGGRVSARPRESQQSDRISDETPL